MTKLYDRVTKRIDQLGQEGLAGPIVLVITVVVGIIVIPYITMLAIAWWGIEGSWKKYKVRRLARKSATMEGFWRLWWYNLRRDNDRQMIRQAREAGRRFLKDPRTDKITKDAGL